VIEAGIHQLCQPFFDLGRAKNIGYWMDRLTLSTQFFTHQYGPNSWNSYLGVYESKMSPSSPILQELTLPTPLFSARYGRFGNFFCGTSYSMNVSDMLQYATFVAERMLLDETKSPYT